MFNSLVKEDAMENKMLVSIGEFLAHLIVVDKQIHSNEMSILEKFMIENQFDSVGKESIYKILGDADDKNTYKETLTCNRGF